MGNTSLEEKKKANMVAYVNAMEMDRVLSLEVAERISDKNFVEVEYVKTTRNKEKVYKVNIKDWIKFITYIIIKVTFCCNWKQGDIVKMYKEIDSVNIPQRFNIISTEIFKRRFVMSMFFRNDDTYFGDIKGMRVTYIKDDVVHPFFSI